jgi:DNA-binding beta-propeller fold protein YncE
MWQATFSGTHFGGSGSDSNAFSLALSPDGSRLFVSGYASSLTGCTVDAVTLAYDAVKGTQVWSSVYASHGSSVAASFAVAVSPDGTRVIASGTEDYNTNQGYEARTHDASTDLVLAFDAGSGAQLWTGRYSHTSVGGPVDQFDYAYLLGISPDSKTAVASGVFHHNVNPNSHTFSVYGTLAYPAT